MQRSVERVMVVFLTVGLVASLNGSASALIERRYQGETSQGEGISAKVVSREGRSALRNLTFRELILTCEDASELRWGIGISWGGGGLRLGADHRVEWDEVWLWEAFAFHGRFWPGHARGDVRYTIAVLTSEEEAMVCSTGDLTWEMQRVAPAPASRRDGASLDGITRVRVTADGDVLATSREL